MNLLSRFNLWTVALFFAMTGFADHALAAPNFNIDAIVHWAVVLIIVGVIFGILLFLLRKAPFIPPEIKTGIEFALWVLLGIAVIYVLLSLI